MTTVFASRLAQLRAALGQAGLRGAVLHQPPHLFHLTGWLPPAWAASFAVIGERHLILVSPLAPPAAEMPWITTLPYESFSLDTAISPTANALAALQAAVGEAGVLDQPVGAVLAQLPAAFGLPLSAMVRLQDMGALLLETTAVKDAAAQQAIRGRVAMLDRGFAAAEAAIRPGVSELEVFSAVYLALAQALGGPLTLECCFASGPRTLAEEPQPTNKRLEPGEMVLIDLFPNLGGYAADYTRNFAVSRATDAQRRQHAALERALATAEAALRPGVLACEIDRLVRSVIAAEGYGEHAYRHHTGHAFGLVTPEAPWLIPADRTPLRAGMIIAVEPGIYHPVNGGMRLEGDYLITEAGCEPLAGYPATLTICG